MHFLNITRLWVTAWCLCVLWRQWWEHQPSNSHSLKSFLFSERGIYVGGCCQCFSQLHSSKVLIKICCCVSAVKIYYICVVWCSALRLLFAVLHGKPVYVTKYSLYQSLDSLILLPFEHKGSDCVVCPFSTCGYVISIDTQYSKL